MDSTDSAADARYLRAAIRALVRRFALTERADVSCCGMTVAQAATLEILAVEGPMRLGDLGRRLGITPSTLTRNLSRLEERDLIRRAPDPEDARASVASLSPAGQRAAAEVEQQEIRFAGSVLDRLPPARRDAVLACLDTLLDAVRNSTERCCPGAFDHLMQSFPRREKETVP